MIFITNRMRLGSPRLRPGSAFKFDFRYNVPSTSVYFCRRTGPDAYIEVGSTNIFDELSQCKQKHILLLIHGFNVLPDVAFDQAANMQQLFDDIQQDQVLVVPMIWPCDDDAGIVEDYWDDQKSARESKFGFARIMSKFLGWQKDRAGDLCTKRISVLAHSMGALVLMETLNLWQSDFGTQGVPMLFGHVFLAAADVVNDALERDQLGRYISDGARNVVVYYAADDIAMNASKVANVADRSRRLGHTGPDDWDAVSNNIFALDCDDFNNQYDPPLGHGYFSDDNSGNPGLVLQHMARTMKVGRVFPGDPDKRHDIMTDSLPA